MPFIMTQPIDSSKALVTLVHNMPDDPVHGITPEMKSQGVMVAAVPEPPQPLPKGKMAVRYYNPQTKEFFFEYVDRPLTQEEQFEQLKGQNLDLMAAMADIAAKVGVFS